MASKLEHQFSLLWAHLGGPELTKEFKFHPVRRWRADFAHQPSKTLIEIEGGVWSKGRHTRGGGFINDCEKYNAAALEGWTVFRLAGKDMISRGWLLKIKEFIGCRA